LYWVQHLATVVFSVFITFNPLAYLLWAMTIPTHLGCENQNNLIVEPKMYFKHQNSFGID